MENYRQIRLSQDNTYIEYKENTRPNPKLPNHIYFDGDLYWIKGKYFQIAGFRPVKTIVSDKGKELHKFR